MAIKAAEITTLKDTNDGAFMCVLGEGVSGGGGRSEALESP